MYKGVDISNLQGSVDFKWLVSQGYSFVICRNYVGNDFKDSNCNRYLEQAKLAGLKTAVYNFLYILPDDPTGAHKNRSPEGQATLHSQNTPVDQVVFADVEFPEPGKTGWDKWKINAVFVNDWVLRYLKKYEELSGQKPIVYTYPFFAKATNFDQEMANYRLWIASYVPSAPSVPAPWVGDQWVVWQNGGGNLLTLPNGVKCDTDICKDLSIFDLNTNLEAPPTTASTNAEAAAQPDISSTTPTLEVQQPVKQPSTEVSGALSGLNLSTISTIIGVVKSVVRFILGLIAKISKK